MAYNETFIAHVWPVIIELMEMYIAPVFNGRLSYNVAKTLIPPLGIYQSQDGGGNNDDHINQNGWKGLVTIRCIDTTLLGAFAKAAEVATALPTMEHSTYDIVVKTQRPITLPIERITQGSVYTAGLVVELGIYPKT